MARAEGDPTVQLPQLKTELYGRKKRGRRILTIATTSVLSMAGLASCFGSGNENEGPTHAVPSISTPGEATSPFAPPSSSVSPSISIGVLPAASSLCDTQPWTEEGKLPLGTPTLSATPVHPSVFVVSPERAIQQSFKVKSENTQYPDWHTVTHDRSVGIVGLVTADTIFDTTQGRTVWAKTCEPTSYVAGEEVKSRVNDLCKRPDMEITEVVIYNVGADGKPVQVGSKVC